ncbi:MAG: DNA-formamidopyrimidine glycosylase [Bacilli bacterium]|nr:DNA-formamidopyrimidine glycosylase [Bacilli bacterium]
MPELPEVETVKNTLKRQILNKKILLSNIYWSNIIAYPEVPVFKEKIKNQRINDILRRGKWLMFELDDYFLLSHLRMEGKYFIRKKGDQLNKHEHIVFLFDDDTELRYHDTRKFGKMYLLEKNNAYDVKPLNELGLEPWDERLDVTYLKNKFNKKPIKIQLLDQSIISGIGNIYADEILFLSKIYPEVSGNKLSDENLKDIIKYTREVLSSAIKLGGTTVKSYTSSEGVHGRFQEELLVHTKKICPSCGNDIIKIVVGGRGTYFCPKCQKR